MTTLLALLAIAVATGEPDPLAAALYANRTIPAYQRLVAYLGGEEVAWAGERETREKQGAYAFTDGVRVRLVRRRWMPPPVSPRSPSPLDYSSVDWDLASIIRHEMGHRLYRHLEPDQRAALDAAAAPVTGYARSNPGEAFAEAVALVTHPAYDPTRYSSRARKYLEAVAAALP